MAKKGPSDIVYRKYAVEIANQDTTKETIPQIAQRVFGWGKAYSEQKAWEAMKHPEFVKEKERLDECEQDQSAMSKEEKLINNRILLKEAYATRDYDTYIKLLNADNRMQGHERVAEIEDKKVDQAGAIMMGLMAELRAANRDKIANARHVSEEIHELKQNN